MKRSALIRTLVSGLLSCVLGLLCGTLVSRRDSIPDPEWLTDLFGRSNFVNAGNLTFGFVVALTAGVLVIGAGSKLSSPEKKFPRASRVTKHNIARVVGLLLIMLAMPIAFMYLLARPGDYRTATIAFSLVLSWGVAIVYFVHYNGQFKSAADKITYFSAISFGAPTAIVFLWPDA